MGLSDDLHSSYESEFRVVESSGLEFLDVEVSERLGSIVALHLFVRCLYALDFTGRCLNSGDSNGKESVE